MKIVLSPEVSAKLETFARIYPREFSGFGFVEREKGVVKVYDIVLLDVGSEVYTEISTQKVMNLMTRPDADKMKLWFHRHPIDVWSGTDLATILTQPLGGAPELVRWSASIVLTPHGWIGRVDNYLNHSTVECQVEPNAFSWARETLSSILSEKSKSAPLPLFESTTRFVQSRFADDELDAAWYEEQLANKDLSEEDRADLEDQLEALEVEQLRDEAEEEDLAWEEAYTRPIPPGHQITGLTQSSWYKRLFNQ